MSSASADSASEDRASEDRASEDRASDDRASEDRASDDRASEDRASEDRASDDRASDDAAGAPVPGWLSRLAAAAERMAVPDVLAPPPSGGRRSAVLVLFGEQDGGPDVLLVQRSPWLRRHAGQPAFPGGAIDAADGGPVGAALREAAEEARVDPAGVQVLAVLPDLYISRSAFCVTPVLAWWRQPGPVGPGDTEVTAVRRVPVADLADPANRLSVRLTSGYAGPAFRVAGMLIWGFTGLVVDRLLALGGWEVPWDASKVTGVPPQAVATPQSGPAERP